MPEVRRYALVDVNDKEADYEYSNYNDAVEAGRRQGCAVVAKIYRYDGRTNGKGVG